MIGTRVSVDYPRADTTGMGDDVQRVVLIQEVNKHDLLIIDHPGSLTYLADTLRSGSPVHMQTQSGNTLTDWYGYVDSVTPSEYGYSPDSPLLIGGGVDQEAYNSSSQVVCVGLTYPLKKSMAATLSGDTVNMAVAKLVHAENLMPCVSDSKVVQTISPAGRSVWQVITDLGTENGCLTFSTGSTVNWLTPKDIFEHFAISAPVLTHRSQSASLLDPKAMDYWEEDVTDNNSHDADWRTLTTLSGLDPLTGTVLEAEIGEGLFTRQLTDPVRSSTTLTARVEAAYNLAFSRVARITGRGNSYVNAGKPVFVKAPSGHSWWLVRKVEHVWSPQDRRYTMQVTLVAHDDLPNPAVRKHPEVSLTRKSPFPGSLQLESIPALEATARTLVTGGGSWGALDRWKATTYIPVEYPEVAGVVEIPPKLEYRTGFASDSDDEREFDVGDVSMLLGNEMLSGWTQFGDPLRVLLLKSAPLVAGGSWIIEEGVEHDGEGYERGSLPLSDLSEPQGHAPTYMSNLSSVECGSNAGMTDWEDITHVAVTSSDSNTVLSVVELGTPVTVLAGQSAVFHPGDLRLAVKTV